MKHSTETNKLDWNKHIWKMIKDWKTQKKEKKVNYPDKNCIKLSLKKRNPSKNRKFKWNEHRKVTRKEWKGMKDEIEKYTCEI